MNLLVILTGTSQACNTRQMQHYSGWSNNFLEKACLKGFFIWLVEKKTEGCHTKQNGMLSISMSFSSIYNGKRNRVR